MKPRNLCNILILVLCSFSVTVFAHNDTIYYGTTVKLDIASPIIVPASTNWKIQHYEMAVNVRLAKKWYPTVEFGYAGGYKAQGDSIQWNGHGGFFRIGCDINPLKKHPDSPHALLVGIRLGAAMQEMVQTGETEIRRSQISGFQGDCWGEIVAGCQVEIAKVNNTSFYMGWMGRFKALFTRSMVAKVTPTLAQDQTEVNILTPIYIPGFGVRDNIGWGVSYHLGWRF